MPGFAACNVNGKLSGISLLSAYLLSQLCTPPSPRLGRSRDADANAEWGMLTGHSCESPLLRVIPQLAPRCGAECVSSWYDDDNDEYCVVGVTMLPQLLLVESAHCGGRT